MRVTNVFVMCLHYNCMLHSGRTFFWNSFCPESFDLTCKTRFIKESRGSDYNFGCQAKRRRILCQSVSVDYRTPKPAVPNILPDGRQTRREWRGSARVRSIPPRKCGATRRQSAPLSLPCNYPTKFCPQLSLRRSHNKYVACE